MKILIYSDVHGNLPAFESILKNVGKCDQYISLGDIVNYGPWSNECVDLALSLKNSICIMGNHDIAYLNRQYTGEHSLVIQFFQHTIECFDRYEQISSFITEYQLNQYKCIHTINKQYVYPDTEIILDNNYLIGHSHHQFCYQNNNFVLYNAGSVGQNRKIINIANYLVFYPEENKIEMRYVKYDVDVVIQKMKSMKYPEECIAYYLNKEKA